MDADLIPFDPYELPLEAGGEEVVPVPGRRRRHATRVLTKTAVLGIRMAPGERKSVNAAARRAGGREASAWAREVILAAAAEEELPSLDAEAHEELLRLRRDLNSGVGSNLNQVVLIANRAGKEGRSPNEDALIRALEATRAALEGLRADLARAISPRGRR